MARPRYDVGRLQFCDDVSFDLDNGRPIATTLHFHESKETQIKTIRLDLMDNTELFPVRVLLFVEKFKPLRDSLLLRT
jgi:hypothetical protein